MSAAVLTATPNPGTRPYQPFGGARQLFYCKDEEILLDGPAGTGKSRALLEKVHLCLMKYPGARALAVRKTRASMTESVLVTFEEKVLRAGDPVKDGPMRAMRRAYSYGNGSEFVIGGMDKADKIMSTEFDLVVVFEATELTEDDWEKLTTRLRNGRMPYQQIIGDCNPSYPTHWLNQRALAGRMARIYSRHTDNPTVTPVYLAKLQRLTGARRARLYEGKWAQQEGLVYEDYDPDVHLIDQMPEGWQSWRKVRVIDFGYTNPFVCQWWAIDGDGRMYRYREIYRTQTLVEDHAKKIRALSEGERYEATLADHDAEDRATLDRHGIRTAAAYKAVSEGIQAVQERLRPQPDGRPRIFYLRDALVEPDPLLVEGKKPYATEQEFDNYVWPKAADGKPVKEEPVKVDDHGMDTTRYCVAYVDELKPIAKVNLRILGE